LKIGCTATRKGLTTQQKDSLRKYLQSLPGIPHEFHHGDCVGGDAEFHDMVVDCIDKANRTIIIHPPTNNSLRAYKQGDEYREAKSYLVRNREIVNEVLLLIGMPCDMIQQTNGGTWYTIGYAKKVNCDCVIIWPDGSISDV
jgi:hypothetical protein